MKRLYRSASDRKISGVCGGMAAYFGIDSTLIRILWAVFACTGAGVVAYIIAILIVPEE